MRNTGLWVDVTLRHSVKIQISNPGWILTFGGVSSDADHGLVFMGWHHPFSVDVLCKYKRTAVFMPQGGAFISEIP